MRLPVRLPGCPAVAAPVRDPPSPPRYEGPPVRPGPSKLFGLIFCFAAQLAIAGCANDPHFRGPLPARNQHPAQLVVGRLEPREARVAGAGEGRVAWRNAYSSLFLGGSEDGSTFRMDGEYLRTSVAGRIGLGGGFDLALELPFAHASGGFLDSFLIDWHAVFGFPDQGRSDAGRDHFVVDGSRDGRLVWSLDDDGFEMLDLPIVLGWQAIGEPGKPLAVLLRGGVELPVGDDARGYGSGGLDWLLGATVEWRGRQVAWNAHVEHSFAATPAPTARAGFEFADVTSFGAGGEFAISDDWSLLVQLESDRSTLRHLGLPRTSREQWLLWAGLRTRLGESLWLEGGIGEDLSQNIAPDFTAWFGLGAAW